MISLAFLIFLIAPNASALEMTISFDHDLHLEKVFKANKISCNHCHNFVLDVKNQKITFNENAKKSILKLSHKQICHECHQSAQPQFNAAPKSCFTCHRNMEGLSKVKPLNHENTSWKSSHSTEARVAGESCSKCHMTSQCAKCHLHRQDTEPVNHSRNFRFFHSVQARAQPERCDTCHTKTYCSNCHMGVKK